MATNLENGRVDVGDAHDGQPSGSFVLHDDLLHGRQAVLLLHVEFQDSNRGPGIKKKGF